MSGYTHCPTCFDAITIGNAQCPYCTGEAEDLSGYWGWQTRNDSANDYSRIEWMPAWSEAMHGLAAAIRKANPVYDWTLAGCYYGKEWSTRIHGVEYCIRSW